MRLSYYTVLKIMAIITRCESDFRPSPPEESDGKLALVFGGMNEDGTRKIVYEYTC